MSENLTNSRYLISSFSARWALTVVLLCLPLVPFFPGTILVLPGWLILAAIFYAGMGTYMEKPIVTLLRQWLITAISAYLMAFLWIKAFSSGQIGYGNRLQIDGAQITVLGHWTLIQTAVVFASFIAAAITIPRLIRFTLKETTQ
ncbi:hypothetical protein [Parasedimentitalea huanghaiensis]|uniref:Transmembrane protein n=1 Tax=Parasedimentitalea huanghaiensis TaxID=2682100 RepID=A0A6L6WBF8_9RHOB|nr:hypothetical protein [Zongyanglinia huanghaiensis]MVO15024.1 hypothetical protein [Zongyanglinia huanghaiensis]